MREADRTLAGLLREVGSTLDAEALDDLIAGVAAAPPGVDPHGWLALVADVPAYR